MAATISPLLADFITPLSDATARLLREDKFLANPNGLDRLGVGIHLTVNPVNQRTVRRFALVPFTESRTNNNASPHAQLRWWNGIPGAERNPVGPGCTAPLTDTTVLCTLAAWPRDKIKFADAEAKMEFLTKFHTFLRNQKVTQYVADYKRNGVIPEHAPMGPAYMPFMPHQRVAALCVLESEAYNLFMEMRTGKTGAIIGAWDADCVEVPGAMHLVVCPKNVRSNWVREITAFTTKKVHIVTMRGDKLDRVKALLTAFEYRKDYDYTAVICSYEGLSRTLAQIVPYRWRWGVLDESHYFKSSKSLRWQSIRQLRDSCQKRTALTGTPICNTALDLYTQLEWLDEGHSGFPNEDEFRHFYGTFEMQGQGFERLVGLRNMPLLQERLTQSAFLISMKEALPNLPPVSNTIIEVEMSKHQTKVYHDLSTQLYAEIERDLADPGAITINNVLTKLLRLSQVTSGFVALDGEIDLDTGRVINREIDRFDPNPKLDAVVEKLKELEATSKTIIWARYVTNIRQIAARLREDGYKCVTFYGDTNDEDRDAAIHAFNNDPETRIFIGNQSCGGVGVNLSGRCAIDGVNRTQCDTIFYYSQGWSQPERTQSTARPRDKNCTWPITVYDFLMVTDDGEVNTIDHEILNRVLDKINHALQVQDIREMLSRVLLR